MTSYDRDNSRNNFNESNQTQLFFAKGRNDGIDSDALVDFISSKTQIDADTISNIKILDAFSFFVVSQDDAEIILDYFQAKAGEGRPLVSRAKRKNSDDRGRRDYNDRNSGGYRNNDRRDDRRDDRGGNRNYGNNDRFNSRPPRNDSY